MAQGKTEQGCSLVPSSKCLVSMDFFFFFSLIVLLYDCQLWDGIIGRSKAEIIERKDLKGERDQSRVSAFHCIFSL